MRIDTLLSSLESPKTPEILAPSYLGDNGGPPIALGVESMRRHMTDEGSQLTEGLKYAGYHLCGKDYEDLETDVIKILDRLDPGTVFVQDKREWLGITADRSRDPSMRFENVEELSNRPDIFKVGVIKDAHKDHNVHVDSAEECGTHAWVCYYNPRIVKHLAPFVRKEHLIRTYHSLDKTIVPTYRSARRRRGVILSGAVSSVYPLRRRLIQDRHQLPACEYLRHPGYHRNGSCTREYIENLALYKVSICTCSIYGYSLRKIMESTAAGCMVLTNLPEDDCLPEIDGNLTRIEPGTPTGKIAKILEGMLDSYNADKQEEYAEKAQSFYDFRAVGERLARDIENLRTNWVNS